MPTRSKKQTHRRRADLALRDNRGFTLAEVVLVVIIVGILAGVAMRGAIRVTQSARVEETKQTMLALEFAVVGNPDLQSNGTRSDYGYVGDVGALPPNLQALVTDPGLGTWKGPYVHPRRGGDYQQCLRDAWNQAISLSGTEITSSGSGQNIIRRLAPSTAALTSNMIHGVVIDSLGRGPDSTMSDSTIVTLYHPDGSGGTASRNAAVNRDGYFEIAAVPIGVHRLDAVFTPSSDSLTRYIDVAPGTNPYLEIRLPTAF